MADPLLSTYLNDHLASSLAALELARRAAVNNRGSPMGERLEQLASSLEEDRELLQRAMERLGIAKDRAKLTVGWAVEKLGRLKLNGRLVSYSPLSRVEELELLALGVEGKLLLWQGLARLEAIEQAQLPVDQLMPAPVSSSGSCEGFASRRWSARSAHPADPRRRQLDLRRWSQRL